MGEYVLLDVKNSDDIRLLGPHYYIDCYTFWDLQRCREAFYGNDYQNVLNRLKGNSINLYNGDGTMAVIDFSRYMSSEDYLSSLSSNIKRDIKKSSSLYTFKEYQFDDFIPDFCEINRTQAERKGAINPWYLNSPEFFIDTGNKPDYWKNHYTKWYGIFRFQKHYKQFDKTTDKKLIAYCQVNVDGEMASLGLLWGHAAHYKQGIMFHLITSVVAEVMRDRNVKALVYYGWGQYPEWKKRMLFEPTKLYLKL